MALLVMGFVLSGVGFVLLLKPTWVDWIDQKTNLRGYRPGPVKDDYDRLLEKRSRLFRKLFPLGFVVVGLGCMASALAGAWAEGALSDLHVGRGAVDTSSVGR